MDSRNLPGFDNHYSSATLIDNWREDRLFRSQQVQGGGAGPSGFTLSGASPEQAQRDTAEWNRTVSTYTDAHGSSVDASTAATAASMCRPCELPRELLLGAGRPTGRSATGEPMSAEWGAHWKSDASKTSGALTATTTGDEKEAQATLFGSTAAARQQSGVRNLYESNHRAASRLDAPATLTESGSPALYKTLDNTAGSVRGVDDETSRPVMHQPDEGVADRFATTKSSADTPVAHYFFQRKLPPTVQ